MEHERDVCKIAPLCIAQLDQGFGGKAAPTEHDGFIGRYRRALRHGLLHPKQDN